MIPQILNIESENIAGPGSACTSRGPSYMTDVPYMTDLMVADLSPDPLMYNFPHTIR
jgi:hypothetical protein